MFRRLLPSWLAAAALGLALSACAGQAPSVAVLGVSPPRVAPQGSGDRVLFVFVEVHNPTSRDLELSRLEYRLRAQAWFEAAGNVPLHRDIAAGSSAVVEIPVPVKDGDAVEDGVPYTLEGRIFALENEIERSWHVEVEGAFVRDLEGGMARPVPVQIAGTVD